MKKWWIPTIVVLFSSMSPLVAQEDIDNVSQPSKNSVEPSAVVPLIFKDSFEVFVGPQPDLIVVSPSVDDDIQTILQLFNITATVVNQGTADTTQSTNLIYYWSEDNIITSADTGLGSNSVPILTVGENSEQVSISVDLPGMPGTYWVGACVDPLKEESDTDNQCSDAVEITINAPDLVVIDAGVSDNKVDPGEVFTLSAKVRNQGDLTAGLSTLTWRRSDDSVIDNGDSNLGSDSILSLPPGNNSPIQSLEALVNTSGTYWVGACVSVVADEFPTNNQCSAGVQIEVAVQGEPDLVAVNTMVDDESLTEGQNYLLSVVARNQGTATATNTTLIYYQSDDSTIDTGDTAIGSDSVPSLPADGNSPQNVPIFAPSAGTYWVGACIDAVAGEINTANQCTSSPVEITVTVPGNPDMVVVNSSVSNSGLTPGESYTVFAVARNQGTDSSAGTNMQYYQSSDDVITTGDIFLGTDAIPGLNAGQDSSQNLPTTAPSQGVYWVGACIDSVPNEVNTSNQCTSTPIQILVGDDADGDRLPDFVETNTRVYGGMANTGTDPNDSDTDGDSIDDGDEVLGTLDGLDLPAMGTNPLRIDLLFEYDWFDDSLECDPHSHRPTAGIAERVTVAFNNSPVPNPDGSTGVNVIHDYGQGGVFTGGNLIADPNGVLGGGFNAEFANYKSANFASNRNRYFHYVMLPHRYNTNSGSSGLAELPGDDMIVSLYCANSEGNVANTIVHEVGHNLNIRHGGFENCNYKPNYNSVMNYRYQFPGVDSECNVGGDGVLDYSYGDRNTLNENSLDENVGICDDVAIDWDSSGMIENPVSADINTYDGQVGQCGGVLSTSLQDHDDWGNAIWSGILDGDRSADAPFTKEIIVEQPVPVEFR